MPYEFSIGWIQVNQRAYCVLIDYNRNLLFPFCWPRWAYCLMHHDLHWPSWIYQPDHWPCSVLWWWKRDRPLITHRCIPTQLPISVPRSAASKKPCHPYRLELLIKCWLLQYRGSSADTRDLTDDIMINGYGTRLSVLKILVEELDSGVQHGNRISLCGQMSNHLMCARALSHKSSYHPWITKQASTYVYSQGLCLRWTNWAWPHDRLQYIQLPQFPPCRLI